jgi:phage shock protein E
MGICALGNDDDALGLYPPVLFANPSIQGWLQEGVFILKRLFGDGKMASSIVKQKLASGAMIVDVRTPDEFRDGAYPGAKNIPLSDLGRRMGEIPMDKPVVLYCASGARSSSAARAMKQAGYADVINAGGLADMPC